MFSGGSKKHLTNPSPDEIMRIAKEMESRLSKERQLADGERKLAQFLEDENVSTDTSFEFPLSEWMIHGGNISSS